MGTEDSTEPKNPQQEVVPYRFRQKDEDLGKRTEKFSSVLSANKKMIAMAIGIIILVIVGGTLTGNMIKKNNELRSCQKSLTDSYSRASELSGNITSLEFVVSSLSGNLSYTEDCLSTCEVDYESCIDENEEIQTQKKAVSLDLSDTSQKLKEAQKELSNMNKELDNALEELETAEDERDEALTKKELLEGKYARYKCCAFYEEGYRFYTLEEGEVRCCYQEEEVFTCGFGQSEKTTSEAEVMNLNC
ncbi:MAG: hypothetical protein JW727_01960 [Candidatus Aenigmarchaeota archaeon]|nr:hypothetical protein [Candidatus Aenigmarchaeota archaeon]